MPSHNQLRIMLITLAVAALVAISVFVFHGALGHWLADTTGKMLAPAAQRLGHGKALIALLLGQHDVVAEREALQVELERIRAAAARVDELEQENQFLRAAVGLAERVGRQLTDANAFAYIQEGGVRQMTINKGSSDWIAPGDIVLTEHASMVGIVMQTYSGHSIVRTMGDVAMEVTGRIAGTQISGLVRRDAGEGLVLDLVEKNELVTEGQVVLTSGNDHVPGGLIIGTVRSVDNDRATLFQVVRVSPIVPSNFSGHVLIIRP